ncbi:Uncharacterized conserved protein [Plasmopara halstedii]|uniref:Uncharacterized conserved protein n=1 Tax=Plasmopara halstedii TaxID=4781 RepID=A0A0P1AP50_PLAHL|nr:Uncharacterized conserved protein [Plasmopara halstedii]CEG42946.1 Uncharacterized conserved protein [Plasmopara halstedii]|eukprot:XP_024579315.1 Uncharacterized conserved protein [Plasmopara halstedii]
MKVSSLEEAKVWYLNPMRFMQLVLATTMLLSVTYMWQFTKEVTTTTENRDTTAAKTAETTLTVHIDRTRAHTYYVIRGFEEAHKFVREYDVETMGPLFFLFTSDMDANGTYWFNPCQMVKTAVLAGFKRAPRRSRLLEIQVGSEAYWNDFMNPFRQNQLFYIDYLPTLMRYDGGGNSSALLAGPHCLNQDLLDVVFKVSKSVAHKNRIINFDNARQVMDFLASYDFSYPLFLFFVSGVHHFNNRLWCPFCDKAELPVTHLFNSTAPDNAVLLRIVVAREPRQWYEEDNDFVGDEFSDKVVMFDGVPFVGFVDRNRTNNKIQVNEFTIGVDQHEKLQNFFRQKAPGMVDVPAAV